MLDQLFVNTVSRSYSDCLLSLLKSNDWISNSSAISRLSCLDACKKSFAPNIKKEFFCDNPVKIRNENGMNTPGLLLDRLSILHCKYHLSISAPQERTAYQISNIERALLNCGYTETALLEKEQVVTNCKVSSSELCIETFMQLHFSNIAMWINQDLLYTKSPEKASLRRLRDYLVFFKESNELRNKAIAAIDDAAMVYAKMLLPT